MTNQIDSKNEELPNLITEDRKMNLTWAIRFHEWFKAP